MEFCMLKISARTAYSSIIALALIASNVQAKDIPIVRKITFLLPLKEFSTIEFPFEIKSHDFTPFVSLSSSNKDVSSDNIPTAQTEPQDYALPNLDDKKNPLQATKPSGASAPNLPPLNGRKKPIEWQKGGNFFKFYPRKVGETQLIVFGYEKYPIVINLKVVENNEDVQDSLYKFIDYEAKKDVAQKFESTNHEKIVVAITKALYNGEPPKGYEVISKQEEFTSGGLHFRSIKEFQGKNYSGVEYLMTNLTQYAINTDAEIFKGQKGIYGITFIHDIIEPGKGTRLFIVKQRGADD